MKLVSMVLESGDNVCINPDHVAVVQQYTEAATKVWIGSDVLTVIGDFDTIRIAIEEA